MMSGPAVQGAFSLKSGVRLQVAAEGGMVIQENPLRLIKVNGPAFEMLKKLEQGIPQDQNQDLVNRPAEGAFLDRLHQAGLLEWSPSPAPFHPFVTIIIPVYNRAAEIAACLESLSALRYPRSKLEIIVVDDASKDDTAAVVKGFGVRLITLRRNQGPAAARNAGTAMARGEIIAFIDSDCLADPGWLEDLIPYFQDPRLVLVGGRVEGFFQESRMDRYEAVCSALDMGPRPIMGQGEHSPFYVPTCNLLVRKEALNRQGGLDADLRVGEDVDLCWKLMAAGHHLAYVPKGFVRHKHRNRFMAGYRRRFDYGTSEALLYERYPKISKRFPWQAGGLGLFLAVLTALWMRSGYWLAPAIGILAVETFYRRIRLDGKTDQIPGWGLVFKAVVRGHFHLIFFLTYHLVRYYLLLILVLLWAFSDGALIGAALIVFPTLVEYLRKKPRLGFPFFAFFFLSEQAFYQSGVFWGCIKQKSFRLYRIVFGRVIIFRLEPPDPWQNSFTAKVRFSKNGNRKWKR